MLIWLANKIRERNHNIQTNGTPGRFDVAFSLVELLVVVAIVAILAAIGIPVYLNQQAKAEKATASNDGAAWAVEVGNLAAKYNSFSCDPKTESGNDPNCENPKQVTGQPTGVFETNPPSPQLTGGKISVDPTAKTLTLTLPTSKTHSPNTLIPTQTVPVTVSPNTTMVDMVPGDTRTGYVGYGTNKMWCFIVDNKGQRSVFTNDGQVENATTCPAPAPPVTPNTPYGVPARPTIASITASTTPPPVVTAIWTPAANDSNPATSWALLYKLSTASEWKTAGPYPQGTTTALLPGLKPGVYNFKVAGTNSTGQGEFSDFYTLTIPPYKPAIDAGGTMTCDGASFQWGQETSDYPPPPGYMYNGGTPLSSVELQYKLPASATWTTLPDTSVNTNRTKTIPGLTPNTTYDYRIRATNTNLAGNGAGAVGDWSATKQFTTTITGALLPAPNAPDNTWATNQLAAWNANTTNKRDMVFTLTSPTYACGPVDHFEAVAYADGENTGVVTNLSPVAGTTQTTVPLLDKIDPNTGVPGMGDRNITFTIEAVTPSGQRSLPSPQSPAVLTVPNPPTNVGFHGANLNPDTAASNDTATRNRQDQTETVFWTSPYYTPNTKFRVNLNSYIPSAGAYDAVPDYVNGRIVSANPGVKTTGTGPTLYMDLPRCTNWDTDYSVPAAPEFISARWGYDLKQNVCSDADAANSASTAKPASAMCIMGGTSSPYISTILNNSCSASTNGAPVTIIGNPDLASPFLTGTASSSTPAPFNTPVATFTLPNYRPPTRAFLPGVSSDETWVWVKGYVRSGSRVLDYTTTSEANCTTTETIKGPATVDTTYYQRVPVNDNGSGANATVKKVPCQTFTGFGTTDYWASVTASNTTGESWPSDERRHPNDPGSTGAGNGLRAGVRTTPQTPYAPAVKQGYAQSAAGNIPDFYIVGYEVADTTQRANLNDTTSYQVYDVGAGAAGTLLGASAQVSNSVPMNPGRTNTLNPPIYTDGTGASNQSIQNKGFASCPQKVGTVLTTCNTRWSLGVPGLQYTFQLPGMNYSEYFNKVLACIPPYTTNGTLAGMDAGFAEGNRMGIPVNGNALVGSAGSCAAQPRASAFKFYGTQYGADQGFSANQAPIRAAHYVQKGWNVLSSLYKARACNTTISGGVTQCSNYSDTTPYRIPSVAMPGPESNLWAMKTDLMTWGYFAQSYYFSPYVTGARAIPLINQAAADLVGLPGDYCDQHVMNCVYSNASPVGVGTRAPFAGALITSQWKKSYDQTDVYNVTCWLWGRHLDGADLNAAKGTPGLNTTGCRNPVVSKVTTAGGSVIVQIRLPGSSLDARLLDIDGNAWDNGSELAFPLPWEGPSTGFIATGIMFCNTASQLEKCSSPKSQRMGSANWPLSNKGFLNGNRVSPNMRSCGGVWALGTYTSPDGWVDDCS